MLNFIGAARAADTLIFELSTEHFIRAAIAGLSAKSNPSRKSNMSKSRPTQQKTTIELTARGVFPDQYGSGWRDGAKENREADPPARRWQAQVRWRDFRTNPVQRCTEIIGRSFLQSRNLLPKKRDEIKNKLADLGYEWPDDEGMAGTILQEIANTRTEREFRIVSAPWVV